MLWRSLVEELAFLDGTIFAMAVPLPVAWSIAFRSENNTRHFGRLAHAQHAIMRWQPGCHGPRSVDPWLCAPGFRRVCLERTDKKGPHMCGPD